MLRCLLPFVALAAIWPGVSAADRTVWKVGLSDSVGLSVQLSHAQYLLLVAGDNRQRCGAGIGRTYTLSPIKNFGVTTLTPVVMIYGQPDRTPRLDLIVMSEWFLPTKEKASPRYVTNFTANSGFVLQSGQPTIVRVMAGFNTFDHRAKLGPRNQGMEVVTEFRPDGLQSRQESTNRGPSTVITHRRMNLENWAFANWRLGPGLLQINIGATYRKSEGSGIKPVILWRIGFIINR